MKLNSSLLQAIALGVTLTTVTVATTSCEKIERKTEKSLRDNGNNDDDNRPTGDNYDDCSLCGMG